MSETAANLILLLCALYLAPGALFAVPFALRGAGRVDPRARRGSWGFRLLIVPAAVVLWPLLAARWARRSGPPEERNAHRDAAGGAA